MNQRDDAHLAIDRLMDRFHNHLRFTQGEAWATAQPYDHFFSLAMAVRDQIVDRMIATQRTYHEQDVKRVYYLSLEYLLGRMLHNNLHCLGLYEPCRQRFGKLGLNLERVCAIEPDTGLGNGGLGRLAACYIDSATSVGLPFYGYGIRYEFGIFEQDIVNGWQVERPDHWLRFATPWEIPRPEFTCQVRLYGRVEGRTDEAGRYRALWKDCETVFGLPYDYPIVAHGTNTVNILRLWSARATRALDLAAFNRGGYIEAVRDKAMSETISKVLYPSDETSVGRELRLVQQYFFVACTVQDIIRRYQRTHENFDAFPDKVVLQLNDTHPSLAIAELMRIFLDEHGMAWSDAWERARASFAYTNHTLLPEALETWPVSLLSRVLPRHMQIIFEINQRFLDGEVARRWPRDAGRRERLSLIHEGPEQVVRMAHLAVAGSRRVNGVAALHTDLLVARVLPDFAELNRDRFVNVTNGVTQRRWLMVCNPRLASVISKRIGDGWIDDLNQLAQLEEFAADPKFQDEFMAAKRANKEALIDLVAPRIGASLSPDALFDVQIKRLHEYKRQLMNLLYVVMRYHQMLDDPDGDFVPRVVLFGAKAAPAYYQAKLIIKLINDVANVINRDARTGGRLHMAFVPNYSVTLAEKIIPASDLSEQISTAGKEASGTGNMKFAMNGALTIGTLDGANIEIRDAVGPENFFLFGLTAEQVVERRASHNPWEVYHSNEGVRRALDAIVQGRFNTQERSLYRPIFDSLMHHGDYYMLLADIESYAEAQGRVDELWRSPRDWARAAILNVARTGYFSSDRSVRDYAEKIWNVQPVNVELPKEPVKRELATAGTGRG